MITYLLLHKTRRELWAVARISYPDGTPTCVARAERDLAAHVGPALVRCGRVRHEDEAAALKSYQGMLRTCRNFEGAPE